MTDEASVNRYRRRPEEFDAIKWDGSNLVAIQTLVGSDRAYIFRDGRLCVITLGERLLSLGDWVMKDANGDVSAMDSKSFPYNYVPIGENEPTISA